MSADLLQWLVVEYGRAISGQEDITEDAMCQQGINLTSFLAFSRKLLTETPLSGVEYTRTGMALRLASGEVLPIVDTEQLLTAPEESLSVPVSSPKAMNVARGIDPRASRAWGVTGKGGNTPG